MQACQQLNTSPFKTLEIVDRLIPTLGKPILTNTLYLRELKNISKHLTYADFSFFKTVTLTCFHQAMSYKQIQ